MVNSLSKIRALPDNTRVWCAHEYTLNNLKLALTVEEENDALQARYKSVKCDRGIATVPSLLGIEKKTNPFLRWDVPDIKSVTNQEEPARVFGKLRGMKDLF